MAFLNYVPYSKHFHIILAFPNVWYANLEAKGKFSNLESVKNEVSMMMDPAADPYAAPDPGQIFDRENQDREHLEVPEPSLVLRVDRINGLEEDSNDVQRNQQNQEEIDNSTWPVRVVPLLEYFCHAFA